MKIILQTKRLIIKEATIEDKDGLRKILTDEETMKYYPSTYDEEGVNRWLNWCINSYKENGFGLYSLIEKNTNTYIGDCGLSLQNINGKILPEIGYHINKDYQNKGYATEASRAIKEYIFNNFDFDELYSYMNIENIPSYVVAIKNDMSLCYEYTTDEEKLRVFKISRKTFNAYKNEQTKPYIIRKATFSDIENIMHLVNKMKDEFIGLDTKEKLNEHLNTTKRFIKCGRCNIALINDIVVGCMLYSKKLNMICFLVVDTNYQRCGIGTSLMNVTLPDLDSSKDIIVSTYKEDDIRSKKAWNFYQKHGFVKDVEENITVKFVKRS